MTWGADYASIDGNKPPDFDAFRRAGGSMLWVRGSFGYYHPGHKAWAIVPDPACHRDWSAIAAAGLVRGAYVGPSIMASHTAEEQVAVFKAALDAVGGLRRGVDFPPCLDVEFPSGIKGTGLNRAGVLQWIRDAVAAVRRLFGCWPLIYTSGRVWNDVDLDCLGNPPAPDLVECPLWLARYAYKKRQPAVIPPPNLQAPPVPTPWGDSWHAHQDQGDALGTPGFTSTVDIDRWRACELGSSGGHVAWAQRRLKSMIAYGQLAVDGAFGPQTLSAVRALQANAGLPTTGAIDPKTFCALAWM
jgi:GH25 family lysozyme M1 (1,4-beta-N-acetylmuramidase)